MNDTVASVFDESEWSKVMQPASAALGNGKQNIKFLKKMVAVAISNIAYLRADLPEESFAKRSLGSMDLRVLQKIKGDANMPTNQLIEMVKDGMSAIDKGYLRKLSIVIFEGDEDAEEGDMRKAYETYSFYFGLQDKDFSLTRSSKYQGDVPMLEAGKSIPMELSEEKIMRTVKKLLRRLIAGTQELDVLPDVAHLKICLEYYDDITPEDYQPKGYENSDYTPQVKYSGDQSGLEPHYLGMGQVDMMHQKIALRLRSKAQPLNPEDELHPASIERASQEGREVDEGVNHASNAVSEICLESDNELSIKNKKKQKMELKRKQLEEEQQQLEVNYSKKYKKASTFKDTLQM